MYRIKGDTQMTKREINKEYGIITETFSDKIELELDRELSDSEISDYALYVISFINYLQSSIE